MRMGEDCKSTNPLTHTSLYKKVIIPLALYGCEIWTNITTKNNNHLEIFQHKCLKQIQNLRKTTRSDMVEPVTGTLRISTTIEKRKLYFLESLISLPINSTTKRIFRIRLLEYLQSNSTHQRGFVPNIIQLLTKFELTSFIDDCVHFCIFPTKKEWKNIVNMSVNKHDEIFLKQRLCSDTDFKRFKQIHETDIKPYIMWKIPRTVNDLKTILYVSKIIACVPQNEELSCGLCGKIYYDTIRHFVASCDGTKLLKDKFLDKVINDYSIDLYIKLTDTNDEELLCTLLGRVIKDYEFKDWEDRGNFLLDSARFLRLTAHIFYSN